MMCQHWLDLYPHSPACDVLIPFANYTSKLLKRNIILLRDKNLYTKSIHSDILSKIMKKFDAVPDREGCASSAWTSSVPAVQDTAGGQHLSAVSEPVASGPVWVVSHRLSLVHCVIKSKSRLNCCC